MGSVELRSAEFGCVFSIADPWLLGCGKRRAKTNTRTFFISLVGGLMCSIALAINNATQHRPVCTRRAALLRLFEFIVSK